MSRTQRRSHWLLISFLVVGGTYAGARSCQSSKPDPDQRLAAHIHAICNIAEQNVDSPRPGVKKLMRYMGDHSPDMMHDWGATLVLIERIDDDRAHDERAGLAGRRLHRELGRCAEPLEEFFNAVDNDPEAAETLEHGLIRLNRTLEIIGNGGAAQLPARLGATLDRALGI